MKDDITLGVFENPVIAADGKTYDKEMLVHNFLERGKSKTTDQFGRFDGWDSHNDGEMHRGEILLEGRA